MLKTGVSRETRNFVFFSKIWLSRPPNTLPTINILVCWRKVDGLRKGVGVEIILQDIAYAGVEIILQYIAYVRSGLQLKKT